jgi:hypothetical protein
MPYTTTTPISKGVEEMYQTANGAIAKARESPRKAITYTWLFSMVLSVKNVA